MKTSVKNYFAFLAQFLPIELLLTSKRRPPFLPFYHLVANNKPHHINSYNVKSIIEFEKDLDYLLKLYKPVDLEKIIHSPSVRDMHLSFDDGLKECSTIVAPILKRKGIPATFFVNSGFVDNVALFHRFKRAILEYNNALASTGKKYYLHEALLLDEIAKEKGISFESYLNNYQPYMSTNDILSLSADGFTIGAHSVNHPEFWLLSQAEQYKQVAESMQWVNENFNPKIKVFSFPFTDDGIRFSLFDRLKKNDIVDATFGTAGLKYDSVSFNLQRVPMERTNNWNAQKVIHFEYFYYFVRSVFGKNIVKREL